jgi:amidase
MSLAESLAEPIGNSGITAAATAAELAAALQLGALTAAAVAAFYQARIGRLDDDLRAVIAVSPDLAAQAASSDARRASGQSLGPLDGIPVLVKDNISVAGQPVTAGSLAMAAATGPDAFLVRSLRAAGAIILGKANLSEWANFRSEASSSGWSSVRGQTANPHGRGRNPSGSSSGSAAAVAAGLAPLAIGSETDGSIVSPSSCCGVVGIKPTLGLVSRSGIIPITAAQDTAGPMTRTVADAAALLTVLAGYDDADPATDQAAGHVTDYAAFLDPAALDGARIGIWRAGSKEASARTVAVLDAAIAAMRAGGATIIDPVELADADKIEEPEFAAMTLEFKHDLNAFLPLLDGDHPGTLAELIAFNQGNEGVVLALFGQELFLAAEATSGDLADATYRQQRADALRLARDGLDGALTGHALDAIVSLTTGPAALIDHLLGDFGGFGTSGPAAVAGYPSISVPAGAVSGLPVGISFTGAAWSEPKLIALAHAFEGARDASSPAANPCASLLRLAIP